MCGGAPAGCPGLRPDGAGGAVESTTGTHGEAPDRRRAASATRIWGALQVGTVRVFIEPATSSEGVRFNPTPDCISNCARSGRGTWNPQRTTGFAQHPWNPHRADHSLRLRGARGNARRQRPGLACHKEGRETERNDSQNLRQPAVGLQHACLAAFWNRLPRLATPSAMSMGFTTVMSVAKGTATFLKSRSRARTRVTSACVRNGDSGRTHPADDV